MTTISLAIIRIGGKKYYNAVDLKQINPSYFYGCSRTIRKIISKKNIPVNRYLYANNSIRKGWRPAKDQSKPSSKAQLLLRKKWVDNNMINADDVVCDIQEAPSIVILNDDEKFKDNNGNSVDIETRGERTPLGIYFLAKNVSVVFNMPNLKTTLLHKNRKYKQNADYKCFSEKNTTKKQLYVTYKGMLKILFSSRCGDADLFVDWATKTLFTVQMGSKEQKEELVSGIVGIPAKSLRQVLKKSTNSVPCIYCFSLGEVKNLRKVMKLSNDIANDLIVIKYGYTDDLVRRTNDHMKTYGQIKNVNLKLLNYTYIDPKYLSQAETDIKEFFVDIEKPVKYKSFVELVAIDSKHKKQIEKQFKYIAGEYAGNVKSLNDKIKELERNMSLEKERHNNEILLLKKDNELFKKNMENKIIVLNKNNELLMKDLEIAQLKNKLLSSN